MKWTGEHKNKSSKHTHIRTPKFQSTESINDLTTVFQRNLFRKFLNWSLNGKFNQKKYFKVNCLMISANDFGNDNNVLLFNSINIGNLNERWDKKHFF